MTTRIYLDASPVIYLVQQVAPFADAVLARLDAPDVVRVASELTRMECRVKPLRDADAAILEEFERFFEASVPEVVPLNRAVPDQAAVVRASYGFRTPDAVHLAAAMLAGCDLFLTNDHRLGRFPGIPVAALEP